MKPTFGLYDMAIANSANSSSNLGDVSTNIPYGMFVETALVSIDIYAYKSNEARRFLAGGGEYFQLK
jgi:hypothetical protein